jgi:hypothetical protein
MRGQNILEYFEDDEEEVIGNEDEIRGVEGNRRG